MSFTIVVAYVSLDPPPGLDNRPRKRVCVIGAGANGLAVLQVFSGSRHVQCGDWSIVCFEDREDIGGVWCVALDSDIYGHMS